MHASTGFTRATRSSRRQFIYLVTSFVLAAGLSAGLVSSPVNAAESGNRGLFGSQDPTYDGVYRQSFALMGLHTAGAPVPNAAVAWLIGQQCADGSFMAFRADTSTPCPPSDPQAFTGPDTNSTALAVAALIQVGNGPDAESAVQAAQTWLLEQQARGGGFPYFSGGTADTNSTGLAVAALRMVGSESRAVQRAEGYVRRAMSGCSAPAEQVGGVPYQPGLLPDGLSSSQALLGLAGAFPVAQRTQRQAAPRVTCDAKGKPTDPTAAATRWIAATITANQGSLPDAFTPEQADWNSTALGVVAMAATRTSGRATQLAMRALTVNADAYVFDGTAYRPAALGTLILAAYSTGANPEDFGGIDLPEQLLATMQK